MTKQRHTHYAVKECGVVIGVFAREKAAWEFCVQECAVISGRGWEQLASGYVIEPVKVRV